MNDFFNEQLVSRKKDNKDTGKKIAIGLLSFIACLLSTLVIQVVGFIIGLAFLACGVYFISMLDIEYEYIMTNDILEIDYIYAKKRRKKGIEFNVKDIIAMKKLEDNSEQHTFNMPKKTLDFTSNAGSENVYKIIIKKDKENILIKFEPNDKILEAIKRYCRNIKIV